MESRATKYRKINVDFQEIINSSLISIQTSSESNNEATNILETSINLPPAAINFPQSSSEAMNTNVQTSIKFCDFYASSDSDIDAGRNDMGPYSVAEHLESEIVVDGTYRTIEDSIRNWATESRASHTSINILLRNLQYHFPDLPKDARTILKTSEIKVTEAQFDNGSYEYYGLFNVLKRVKMPLDVSLPQNAHLYFNIDGLPISRSTSDQLWPILGKLEGIKDPFIIGIFRGTGKPSDIFVFLNHFINDLKELLDKREVQVGFNFISVNFGGIISDAPARAFIKGIVGHTGKYGCEKCYVKGEYCDNTVCFLDYGAPLRTNHDFIQFKLNLESVTGEHLNDCITGHIKICSPFLGVVDMISAFPLEYMHLVCLGVMRRLLKFWTSRLPHKLSRTQINKINERILLIGEQMPCSFSRKPRSLLFLDRFKATEFRTLLLYIGPIVFKDSLSKKAYQHFLLLHYAIWQLTRNDSLSHDKLDFVESCLVGFVRHGSSIYGKCFVSYNVHSLIHLVDEYKRRGPLDKYSAFSFESYLGSLKRMLRSNNRPLAQIRNRIAEGVHVVNNRKVVTEKLFYNCKSEKFDKFVNDKFKVCANGNDSSFYDKSGNVYVLDHLRKETGGVVLYGKLVTMYHNYYEYPEQSCTSGILIIDRLSEEITAVKLDDVAGKCIIMKINEEIICCKLNNVDF